MSSNFFIAATKKINGVEFTAEYKFHPTRKWRFDYACIYHKIAVEVEGGAWSNGRHTRGSGFIGDMEKYNEATALGWRLIRVTPTDLLTNNTFRLIDNILNL